MSIATDLLAQDLHVDISEDRYTQMPSIYDAICMRYTQEQRHTLGPNDMFERAREDRKGY